MGDLNTFSAGLDAASKRRQDEREEFNKHLGEPAHFIPNDQDSRFGIGFWKAHGGVIAYRRYANGYDPFSRTEYHSDFIAMLNRVNAG